MGKGGSDRSRLLVVMAVCGLVVGGGLGMTQRGGVAPLMPQAPAAPPGAMVEVHVVGWVGAPGVVSVPSGALVVDAVVAAGGLREGANVAAVNLAAPVSAGQQIVVPGPADPVVESAGGGNGLVAINRATASELETLPGVGPVLAGRIVAYRDQHGPFQQIEDLLGVSGIGESKLAAIRDLLSVP